MSKQDVTYGFARAHKKQALLLPGVRNHCNVLQHGHFKERLFA